MKSGTTEYPKNANPQASTIQIRMVDLNLFRVFDAMMRHRSVRKASQMLSVTPSAVSHALNRLRQTIDDELFIPGEFGMEPTRRAFELAAAVREGLERFELALTTKPLCQWRLSGLSASPRVIILPWLFSRRWSNG